MLLTFSSGNPRRKLRGIARVKDKKESWQSLGQATGEISAGAEPFPVTMQQVVGKPEDISLADMVGQPPTQWVDRGLGVAGDRQCTMLMMYIIAFILN